MPTNKTNKEKNSGGFFKNFWKGMKNFFKTLWKLIRDLLIVAEKILKIVAIFMVAFSASILFMVTSFYLFTQSFGLKESPAFQQIRDRIGALYLKNVEDEIKELESHPRWDEQHAEILPEENQ